MQMLYWICFDRRTSTYPSRAGYARRGTTQHTGMERIGRISYNFIAGCQSSLLPLDEDETIDVLKAFSPSILTAISALSLWAAHTVGPRAQSIVVQRHLYTYPYICLPLALVGIVLSAAASRTNGLACYASVVCFTVCEYAITLGGSCSIVLLKTDSPLILLVAVLLIVALGCAWGWMFAYPVGVRKAFHMCCALMARVGPQSTRNSAVESGHNVTGYGNDFCKWIFISLQGLGRSIARCASTARVRSGTGHVPVDGNQLGIDPEAGVAECDMIHMTQRQSEVADSV